MTEERKEVMEQELEKALLVGLDTGEDDNFERSMKELGELAEACYMSVAGVVTQKMESVNKAHYIGTGKVQEVKEYAKALNVDIVIFDNSLTPSQLRNLQRDLEMPVLDRTTLILDIFSRRAKTREAKLQVETARLQYLLSRLVGMHEALTRQGGASGSMSSKGSGEKKLELDRRKIEKRLVELRRELEEVSKERETQSKRRMSSRIPKVSLVGYTNAGKSTLMNAMVERYLQDEEKKVFEKDMLFATLDTTVRNIEVGNNKEFLLADTVGFIHKLPHGLVKAFRSTLEEVKNADLLLYIIDYSDEDYKKQIEVTQGTLQEIGAANIPVIYVYNKADLCEMENLPKIVGEDKIYMSAKGGQGLTELTDMIVKAVYDDYVSAQFLIPYDKGQIVSYLMEKAQVKEQEYLEDGVRLTVDCHAADAQKYAQYAKMY
ncbi:GTPase HflX [Kineothrix sp. MB12-C1]|uniref:GTPase HflX n=1 Tax=Kineothrix sp. MB12-C1 TaxID=3070215 RepID=UPI0027D29B54|nr:GTPase HflX [Kineothrix sp. MB12-C1]WMC93136.1 GTPase HflX [Kineothrix sp. MB12-C1]